MGRDVQTPAWLAELLAEHGRSLVLYARQWCDCPEDVVQEALVELFAQRRRPERVAAWLFRVVRNGAISAGRSAQRRVRREQGAAASEAWFDSAATAIDAAAASAARGDTCAGTARSGGGQNLGRVDIRGNRGADGNFQQHRPATI